MKRMDEVRILLQTCQDTYVAINQYIIMKVYTLSSLSF